ncbi:hypothetical protein Tco_0976794 [Tanacetum coccineum]|uniref:Uncharacterized protein n=1 Tax=Tanacetum coccineum TaxID=301880 RepID=A0ABQ5EJE5_9ASTR
MVSRHGSRLILSLTSEIDLMMLCITENDIGNPIEPSEIDTFYRLRNRRLELERGEHTTPKSRMVQGESFAATFLAFANAFATRSEVNRGGVTTTINIHWQDQVPICSHDVEEGCKAFIASGASDLYLGRAASTKRCLQPWKGAAIDRLGITRLFLDMAAPSACDFGCGKAEKLALAKYHQVIWQGRVMKTQFTNEEFRPQGRCPLTPESFGLQQ